MKRLALFLAVVASPMVSYAETQKIEIPHPAGHVVPKHAEVCVAATEEDIAALFDRWNASLQTGDVHKVSANYAPRSLLLPTVSSRPRITALDKEDYFRHFLENQPVGRIEAQDSREIEIDCNTAIDAGLYTFTFQKTGASVKARYTFTYKWDGKQWLITSHHSSALPTADAPPEHVHQAVPQHTELCVAATEEDIAALFDRWNASLQTGDVHKVSANYAPTSLLLPTVSSRPRRTALDKEDYFLHFLENQPVGRIEAQDSREIEIDCNTAIDTGLYTFTFQKTGASVKARYTFTYKWDGKQWLITSHHSSALPTADAPPEHVHQAVPQHAELCIAASEEDIAALFDRWNVSLQTGDVHKVSANYAPTSLLLPTVSSRPRITALDKEDYFHHFLENRPVGRIDSREIEIDCNTAIDAGLYTFTFQKTGASVKARYTFTYKWDGKQWLITSHHSSTVPPKE